MSDLLSISKQISDLIHDAETDYDAQVKIVVPDAEGVEKEYTVTDVDYVVNVSDGEATVWLTVVED
jgi:hypothetical protein